jgi:hypothetical protein
MHVFVTVLRIRNPDLVPDNTYFFTDDCLFTVTLPRGKGSDLSGSLFKDTNSIHEGFTVMTINNNFPKAPSPSILILGVRFQHRNVFGGETQAYHSSLLQRHSK